MYFQDPSLLATSACHSGSHIPPQLHTLHLPLSANTVGSPSACHQQPSVSGLQPSAFSLQPSATPYVSHSQPERTGRLLNLNNAPFSLKWEHHVRGFHVTVNIESYR